MVAGWCCDFAAVRYRPMRGGQMTPPDVVVRGRDDQISARMTWSQASMSMCFVSDISSDNLCKSLHKMWLHISCLFFAPHTHLFNGPLSWTTWVGRYQKGKTNLKQQTVSGSGISWAICKSAPCSRQITMPASHHSVFYRPDALPAAQPTASKHWRHHNVWKVQVYASTLWGLIFDFFLFCVVKSKQE